MLADARLGAGAVWRFEKYVDGAVELLLGAFDVAQLELFLARLEVAVRLGDQRENRILGSNGCRRRRGRLRHRATRILRLASGGVRSDARSAPGRIERGEREQGNERADVP